MLSHYIRTIDCFGVMTHKLHLMYYDTRKDKHKSTVVHYCFIVKRQFKTWKEKIINANLFTQEAQLPPSWVVGSMPAVTTCTIYIYIHIGDPFVWNNITYTNRQTRSNVRFVYFNDSKCLCKYICKKKDTHHILILI